MHRRGARDWVFVGFVGVAVAGVAYTGVQRTRYRRAMAALATCAADADTTCAGRALEEARTIDRDNLRTRIGQAQLRVLLGDPDAAERALVEVFATKSSTVAPIVRKVGAQPLQIDVDGVAALDTAVRGDLLLVDGDIAAASGQVERARVRWTEAAMLVDESLVRPRRDRLAARIANGEAQMSASLQQLRDDFEKLFIASEAGQTDGAQLIARDLRDRLRGLASETARQKLGLAIDATQRAVAIARQRKSEGESASAAWSGSGKPEPPDPPTADDVRRNPYAQRYYDQRMADYRRALDRWTQSQNENDRRKSVRVGDLSATLATVMAQARTLFEEGMRAAGATVQAGSTPSP